MKCSCGMKRCEPKLVNETPSLDYYGSIKHCVCGFSTSTFLAHYLCGTVVGESCKNKVT